MNTAGFELPCAIGDQLEFAPWVHAMAPVREASSGMNVVDGSKSQANQ